MKRPRQNAVSYSVSGRKEIDEMTEKTIPEELRNRGIDRVVLASGSPRRLELLRGLIPDFTVMTSDAEEAFPEGTPPHQACMYNALKKAMDVAERLKDPGETGRILVIGADTIVFAECILGKPADEEDAFRTLSFLRGRAHQVYTGVALVTPDGLLRRVFFDRTDVRFGEYSDEAIRDYIRTGDPMDKAGSYAIQGSWGAMVTDTAGSIGNVIGLPVEMLEKEISRIKLR